MLPVSRHMCYFLVKQYNGSNFTVLFWKVLLFLSSLLLIYWGQYRWIYIQLCSAGFTLGMLGIFLKNISFLLFVMNKNCFKLFYTFISLFSYYYKCLKVLFLNMNYIGKWTFKKRKKIYMTDLKVTSRL